MPLPKAIMDRKSRSRKSNVQASKTAAQIAKEEEFHKQREKRMAERKAAMERIKKQQEGKTARGGLGTLSRKGDGNGSGGVVAALREPTSKDDAKSGQNKTGDSTGSHHTPDNSRNNSSSGFSAMVAALAGDNERKTGTSGHNRTGDSTGSHQGVGSSGASGSLRTSRYPDDIYNPGVNENGSYRAPAIVPEGRNPDTSSSGAGTGTGGAKTYSTGDDILWREEVDAQVYEDMKTKGTYANPITSKQYEQGLFNSAEEAAYAFGMEYNDDSIDENKEYGALIIGVEQNGEMKYTYGKVYKGPGKSTNSIANMAVDAILTFGTYPLVSGKLDFVPIGTVHTHSKSDQNAGSILFSWPDRVFLPGQTYLVSPDGALHHLEGTETPFIDPFMDPTDPNYPNREQDVKDQGFRYGEIVRWGMPNESGVTPYKP